MSSMPGGSARNAAAAAGQRGLVTMQLVADTRPCWASQSTASSTPGRTA